MCGAPGNGRGLKSVFNMEKDMEAGEFQGEAGDIRESINITKNEMSVVLKHKRGNKTPGPDQVC